MMIITNKPVIDSFFTKNKAVNITDYDIYGLVSRETLSAIGNS